MGFYTQEVIWDLLPNKSEPGYPNNYSIALFDFARNGGNLQRIDISNVTLKENVVLNYVDPEETANVDSLYQGKYAGKLILQANKITAVTLTIPDEFKMYDQTGKEIKNGDQVYITAEMVFDIVAEEKLTDSSLEIGYRYEKYKVIDEDSFVLFQTVDLNYSGGYEEFLKPYQKMIGYEIDVVEGNGTISSFEFKHPDDEKDPKSDQIPNQLQIQYQKLAEATQT